MKMLFEPPPPEFAPIEIVLAVFDPLEPAYQPT
jgi:hypothetical protein